MLLSTINISHCGRWHKIRLIFNAIGCCNFGTISAGTWPNSSNMLVLKCCGCIHPTSSTHLQVYSCIYKNHTKNQKNVKKNYKIRAATYRVYGVNKSYDSSDESCDISIEDSATHAQKVADICVQKK
jgi:hypothetical protein